MPGLERHGAGWLRLRPLGYSDAAARPEAASLGGLAGTSQYQGPQLLAPPDGTPEDSDVQPGPIKMNPGPIPALPPCQISRGFLVDCFLDFPKIQMKSTPGSQAQSGVSLR